jgi:hypothetical protein
MVHVYRYAKAVFIMAGNLYLEFLIYTEGPSLLKVYTKCLRLLVYAALNY